MAPPPEDSGEREVPAWMVTYADTITLLMTFFVMLLGFSTVDEADVGRLRGPLMRYLGMASPDDTKRDSLAPRRQLRISRGHDSGFENPPRHGPLAEAGEDISVDAESLLTGNNLEWRLTEDGMEIAIKAETVFLPAGTDLRRGADALLGVMADAVRHLPNQIRVRAAGRDRALRSARALSVCTRLARQEGVAAARLNPAVRAETAADPPDLLITVTRFTQEAR